VPFCSRFASIRGIFSCHRHPKGDFIGVLPMDCQFHLIPFLPSYVFSSLICSVA